MMDRVTNRSVMERLKKDLEAMNTIKRRKLEYLGGTKANIILCVLQRKVYGRRPPARSI